MYVGVVFGVALLAGVALANPNPALYFRNADGTVSQNAALEQEFFAEARHRHPDVGLNVIELIEKYGYPIEVHNIQTDDGYLLDVYRIPHGRDNKDEPNKPVVFVMHGLLSSSADWVNMGPGKGLAYILADRGYDVWMGNARGTTWSRKHITLDPDDKEEKKMFWDFSFEEIAVHDIPAMIDLVLAKTGEESIYYIGHSQGTACFWVMMSERPEYNSKIKLMSALAPVAYLEHVRSPLLRWQAENTGVLDVLAKFVRLYEFLPSSEFLSGFGQFFCNDDAPFQSLCSNLMFLIAGWNSAQLNETMLPVIYTNTPAGASTKQIVHFGQNVIPGTFRKYDYGIANLIKYGSLTPPSYKLDNVKAPVALYYGANDLISHPVDVDRLSNELPNVVRKFMVSDEKFNHLDFMWAINAPTVVYEDMIKLMEEYERKL